MKTKFLKALVLLSLSIGNLYAQSADSTTRLAAAYFREAEQASAKQTIWPLKLYGPMMFVDAGTRTAWANMPDTTGILKSDGEIYKGELPKSLIIANTAINWGGRIWSVILWPLPSRHDERLNLVLHESFHRIQRQLGLPAHSPTADHLSSREGRIYFLLELQALKSALKKPANERRHDLESALIFREKRKMLFPGTFNKEQLLEANEGLAEYTGVILGRDKDSIARHLITVIDNVEDRASLIRYAPYVTGPVYGYLLHDIDTAWTLKIDTGITFTKLIRKYYHIKLNLDKVSTESDKRSVAYDGARIVASENLKYEQHEKLVKQYVDLFTLKPVLIISLANMHIGFNPGNLFDLGKYGTVYPTMTLKDDWGNLEVNTGDGALMKNWQIVYLPVKQGMSITDVKIVKGDGWQLNLANGWQIVADGPNYKIVKQ